MTLAATLASVTFWDTSSNWGENVGALSLSEQDSIRNALSSIYQGSPLGRELLESLSSHGLLRFAKELSETSAVRASVGSMSNSYIAVD